MRPTTAASTIRALIAAVPEERLRELIVELILTALRCLAASPGSSEPAVPTGNGRRRHWSPARRAAENDKRRKRRLVRAGSAPKRRGRKGNADAPSNGSELTANGRSGVSPKALWEHAAKLEPKAPWRAIVRELGVNEGAAQQAQRDGILPCTPRAAARFMTL